MANAGFSGILRLTDLNDFIGPSQECIKPVLIEKTSSQTGPTQISYDNGDYTEVKQSGQKIKLKPAQITLNDCLACSGCVTSAETVLIQQQSAQLLLDCLEKKQLYKTGQSNPPLVVVSVSPQSRASLAAKYRLTALDAFGRITSVLNMMGVDYVFDTTFARHLTLLAEQEEFVERFRQRATTGDVSKLPMLASSCPGWICYAEKSHDWILPRISNVRSPQAIMGVLVKDYLARKLGRSAEEIYHVTVMPCFDKKLEASRKDFVVPQTDTPEVDCVISTAEFDELIYQWGLTLDSVPAQLANNEWFPTITEDSQLAGHSGGGSGGYAEQVFRYASFALFGIDSPDVKYSVIRNKDFRELTLTKGDQVLLRVATCYGFRNIQNLVQKLKRGRSNYDYVEVMACPSGCLNGGGQIRSDSISDHGTLLEDVAERYESYRPINVHDDNVVQLLIRDWFGDNGVSSERARRLLCTQYHPVEKASLSLGIKW